MRGARAARVVAELEGRPRVEGGREGGRDGRTDGRTTRDTAGVVGRAAGRPIAPCIPPARLGRAQLLSSRKSQGLSPTEVRAVGASPVASDNKG